MMAAISPRNIKAYPKGSSRKSIISIIFGEEVLSVATYLVNIHDRNQ
jgi:hypothetical protein